MGEIPVAELRSGLDLAEENCPGVHPLMGQMREACRQVFVFSSKENPISGTSKWGSESKKFLQQSRDSECGKSHSGGFDSCRQVCIVVFEWENSISGAYRHNLPNGENLINGRTDSEWEKSQQRSGSEWENPISRMPKHCPSSGKNSISGRIDSEWEKSQQQSGSEWGKSHQWNF